MATPAYLNVGTRSAATGQTSVTPALPGSRTNGNVLIAMVAVKSNAAITPPSDWTPIFAQTDSGTGLTACAFWRIVDGTETAPTFTWTGSAVTFAIIAQYTRDNLDTDNPFGAVGTPSPGSGTTVTSTGFTTTRDNSRAIYMVWNAGNLSLATPTNWTERYDAGSSGGTVSRNVFGDRELATSGSASGDISVTAGGGNTWIMVQAELREGVEVGGVQSGAGSSSGVATASAGGASTRAAAGTAAGTSTAESSDIPAGKWVSQAGNNANPGTFAAPWATIQYAWSQVSPGETIWVKDDLTPTSFSSTSTGSILTQSGSSGNPITLRGWPAGTRRKIDYSNTILDTWGGTGIRVAGAWAILRDLHITEVKATGRTTPYVDGVNIRAANCQMLNCEISNVGGRGLTIGENGAGTNALVQNCDIHDCFDPASSPAYNDADGIQLFGSQTGVVLERNRIWRCCDDGIDMFFQTAPVTVRDNWIWRIGYREDDTTAGGDGTGIKVGSASNGAAHTVEKNLIFDCRVFAISNNDSTTASTWSRNTAIDCGYEAWTNGVATSLQGNAKYGGSNTLTGNAVVRNRNSFDNPPNITESAGWFVTLSRAGVDAARDVDGNLPTITFAHPASGSPLIGAGPSGVTIGAFDGDAGGIESGAGSSSGVAAASGAGASNRAATASASGAATVTATGASTRAGAGTSTGVAGVAGFGSATASAAGATSGGATAAAAGASVRAGSGSAPGAATASATGASTWAASGTAAGVASASAGGASTRAASGSTAGAATVSANGQGIVASAGSAAGVATASATGDVAGAINSGAGSSAGVATAQATGAFTWAASGSAAGVAAASATGRATAASIGTSAGTATATGATGASATIESAGTASGAAATQATGRSTAAASGSVAGVASVSGVAAQIIARAVAVAGAATVVGGGGQITARAGVSAGSATTAAIAAQIIARAVAAAGAASALAVGDFTYDPPPPNDYANWRLAFAGREPRQGVVLNAGVRRGAILNCTRTGQIVELKT